MHTFQPIPVDMLDMNPFTKIGKEWALLTAGNKQESNTMTISWGGVGVLWGKNVVYVFVRDSRYTKESLTLTREISSWYVKKCLLPESRMIPSLIPRLLTNGTKTVTCTPCTLVRSLMCSQDNHLCQTLIFCKTLHS